MGRPRKPRREEEVNPSRADDYLGTFEESGPRLIHTTIQDPHLGAFPSNGYIQNQLPHAGNGLEATSWPTPSGSEPNILGNGEFSSQFPQDTAIDPTLGFPGWENTQDNFGELFSNPAQLHTPPTTLDHDVPNGEFAAQDPQQTCCCLPNLYATLASFQSVPSPSFPFSMGTLKKAARLAYNVAQCQICSQTYNTAVQNAMLLGTLMSILINEYAKLLKHIDERSSGGEKIPFRVGEPSSPFDIRHTGGSDCPMSISIDLSGDEWRLLARKAIHQEIHGEEGTSDHSVFAIVQKMRSRQEEWHQRFASERHTQDHSDYDAEAKKAGEHICVQIDYIEHIKKLLEMLKV